MLTWLLSKSHKVKWASSGQGFRKDLCKPITSLHNSPGSSEGNVHISNEYGDAIKVKVQIKRNCLPESLKEFFLASGNNQKTDASKDNARSHRQPKKPFKMPIAMSEESLQKRSCVERDLQLFRLNSQVSELEKDIRVKTMLLSASEMSQRAQNAGHVAPDNVMTAAMSRFRKIETKTQGFLS
jgi:hypothetical protein